MRAGLISSGFVASGEVPSHADMWGEHMLNVKSWCCKAVSMSMHNAVHSIVQFVCVLAGFAVSCDLTMQASQPLRP